MQQSRQKRCEYLDDSLWSTFDCPHRAGSSANLLHVAAIPRNETARLASPDHDASIGSSPAELLAAAGAAGLWVVRPGSAFGEGVLGVEAFEQHASDAWLRTRPSDVVRTVVRDHVEAHVLVLSEGRDEALRALPKSFPKVNRRGVAQIRWPCRRRADTADRRRRHRRCRAGAAGAPSACRFHRPEAAYCAFG